MPLAHSPLLPPRHPGPVPQPVVLPPRPGERPGRADLAGEGAAVVRSRAAGRLLSSPPLSWPWCSRRTPQTHGTSSSNPVEEAARRGRSGGRAWGPGGKTRASRARLTSSPQSVPQLFLMAQKGVADPAGHRGFKGLKALGRHLQQGRWVTGAGTGAHPSWRPGTASGHGGGHPFSITASPFPYGEPAVPSIAPTLPIET